MAIDSDSLGFLIGERRLRELAAGINQTEDNTKQMIKVLADSFEELQRTLSESTNIRDAASRQNRNGGSQDASGTPDADRLTRAAVDAAIEAIEESARRIRTASIDAEDGRDASPQSDVSSTSERAARARDSRGRFISEGGTGSESEKKSILKHIKNFFGLGGASLGGADVGGIDPTVDAIRELNEAVTPVKNVFKGMSAKAIGLFRGRVKKRRGDEVLSEEQREANRDSSNSDRRQNKLLQSILSAIRGQGGGGLGGLGRLFGGGGLLALLRGGGKALLKKIPLLGALIGGGFLAKDWGNLSSGGKGKGIGQIVGTVVGGMLGSFLGPVGTVAGGTLGNILGGIFGEKIGTWTDSLKKLDFGAIFKDFLKDKFGIGNGSGNKAFIPYANAGQGKMERFKNWASDKLGLGGSTETVVDTKDYSGAEGNTNSAGNVAKDRKARQLGMYTALKKAGFSTEQALAHVGQIGRENSYGDKMFSTHTDPSRDKHGNKIQNGGVMSWNGDRYKAFAKFMRERGVMDADGNMPKTQAALDAQAAYMKKESDDPYYKNKMPTFNNKPHADPREYAKDMKTFYGWARGQDYVRDQNGNFTVPFDWREAENRGNSFIDSTIPMINQQSSPQANKTMPAAKGKPQEAVLFPKGATRPAPIKVPAVTPDLIKIGSKNKTQAMSSAPSDSGIGQTVADRGLAHVMSGGIGYNQNNA